MDDIKKPILGSKEYKRSDISCGTEDGRGNKVKYSTTSWRNECQNGIVTDNRNAMQGEKQER